MIQEFINRTKSVQDEKLQFLDIYRWGAKGTGADVFNHFAESMRLLCDEATELI